MRSRTWHALAVLLAMATLVGACAPDDPADEHPAVQAIQTLLELRADDVRDAEAYSPYFADSALATALAEGSTEPTGTPRVPDWEPPYLSEVTTSTASVVVVWKQSADFPDWPAVNIFLLSVQDERWIVDDAVEATVAPEPVDGAGSSSER